MARRDIQRKQKVLNIARRYLKEEISAGKKQAHIDKILKCCLGNNGLYDESIWKILPLSSSALEGKRILDIGPGGLESTLDILSLNPAEITVIEPFPFGGRFTQEETYKLLKIKNQTRNLKLENINFWLYHLSMEYPLDEIKGHYDFAFCFFPMPGQAGANKVGSIQWEKREDEWTLTFGYGLKHLLSNNMQSGGMCFIVTEVSDPYICKADGISSKVIEHYGGFEPTYPNNELKTVKPISRMNLKTVIYTRK